MRFFLEVSSGLIARAGIAIVVGYGGVLVVGLAIRLALW